MAVLTAPARIKVPTTTTKPWNIKRTINGPSRLIASPPIRFLEEMLADIIRNDHHGKEGN